MKNRTRVKKILIILVIVIFIIVTFGTFITYLVSSGEPQSQQTVQNEVQPTAIIPTVTETGDLNTTGKVSN